MQPQTDFFTLPAELCILMTEFLVSDYEGHKTYLKGALLSCKKMKAEVEHEMTRALLQNLALSLEDIGKA
jgi:hypothetical protein